MEQTKRKYYKKLNIEIFINKNIDNIKISKVFLNDTVEIYYKNKTKETIYTIYVTKNSKIIIHNTFEYSLYNNSEINLYFLKNENNENNENFTFNLYDESYLYTDRIINGDNVKINVYNKSKTKISLKNATINTYDNSEITIKYSKENLNNIINAHDEATIILDSKAIIYVNSNKGLCFQWNEESKLSRIFNLTDSDIFINGPFLYFEEGSTNNEIQKELLNQFQNYKDKRDYEEQIKEWEQSIKNLDKDYLKSKQEIETLDLGVPVGKLMGINDIAISTSKITEDNLNNKSILESIQKIIQFVGEDKVEKESFQFGKNEGRTKVHIDFIVGLLNNEDRINIIKKLLKDTINEAINLYQLPIETNLLENFKGE